MSKTSALIVSLALALGGGMALAQSDQANETPFTPEGYELTGESRNCVSARSVDTIDPINEQAWLITMRNRDVYLSRPNGACRAATSNFTYLQYNVHGSQICRGEIVRVMDRSTDTVSGSCSFGAFEELSAISETGE